MPPNDIKTLSQFLINEIGISNQPLSFSEYGPSPDAAYMNPKYAHLGNVGYTPEQINTLASMGTTDLPVQVKHDMLLGDLIGMKKHELSLYNKWQNSWQNQYLKPAMYGLQGLTTLGNLWLGFKQYGLYKKQLAMAQDQWNQTKQEMNRIRTLRDKLTKQYMGE